MNMRDKRTYWAVNGRPSQARLVPARWAPAALDVHEVADLVEYHR
jgi:hypothetical protein